MTRRLHISLLKFYGILTGFLTFIGLNGNANAGNCDGTDPNCIVCDSCPTTCYERNRDSITERSYCGSYKGLRIACCAAKNTALTITSYRFSVDSDGCDNTDHYITSGNESRICRNRNVTQTYTSPILRASDLQNKTAGCEECPDAGPFSSTPAYIESKSDISVYPCKTKRSCVIESTDSFMDDVGTFKLSGSCFYGYS